MELENSVAKALQDMGYPIFYRNLHISYRKQFLFGEFDIVGRDFIVEVKSGRDITTRGIDFMYTQGLLPTQFRYYVYCQRFADDEIAHMNEEFGRSNMTYINDLGVIRANHEPICECSVPNPSLFMRLLRTPLSTVLQFQRIYMNKYTFIRVYRNVNYIRNPYSIRESIMWSEKIMRLITEGRICIVDKPPAGVPPLVTGQKATHMRRLIVDSLTEPVTVPLLFNVSSMGRLNDIDDVRIADNRTYGSI